MAERARLVPNDNAPTVPLGVWITPRLLDRLEAFLFAHRKDRPKPSKASVTRAALDDFLSAQEK